MRSIIFLMSALFLLSCSTKPEQKTEEKRYTIEDFLKTNAFGGGSFSPKEDKVLVVSNIDGTFRPYSIDLATGSMERQAKNFDNAILSAFYFPNDERFLFFSDDEGNEIYHLYYSDLHGKITKLTSSDNAKYSFCCWNEEEDGFFYASNERDPTVYDFYEMDIETFTPKLIFQNNDRWLISTISPDKKYLTLTKLNELYDSDLYLMDLQTQETKKITEHEGKISYTPLEFDDESTTLYYLTDENSEYSYVKRYNILEDTHETILSADGEVVDYSISDSGKYLMWIVDHGTHSDFKIFDRVEQQELQLPLIEKGVLRSARFSPSEEKICLYISSSATPTDLFVLDLKTQDLKQLTHSLNPSIDPNDLVDGELVSYTSFDGLEIPAILYHPKSATAENPKPALIHVHGGPSAQTTLGYSGRIQYLVNQGYAVLDINYRGSTGYGKTYVTLADKKHGDVDLKDCLYGKAFLQTQDWVDKDKIGIIGGSYGGYLVLAALAFEPDSFTCGVDNCGVSNWIRTIRETPPWWSIGKNWLQEKIGNPDSEEEYLKKISPLFHANNIKKPLLVIQGANDPRVVKAESDEIVEKVKNNGVPCKYVLFEDEGHGVIKKSNNALVMEEITKFLETHLKTVVN